MQSNRELLEQTRILVLNERKITLEILNLINEVKRRRAYVEAGFSSLFVWLTKGLGYSEAAAVRRMKSADLLLEVPEVAEKVKNGSLNLSNLARAQSAIVSEEKRTGVAIDSREVLVKIESCTQRETEQKLAALFPNAIPKSDSIRSIDADHIRAQITFTHEQMEKIDRLKQVLSHSNPRASIADVVEAAVDALLKLKDPMENVVKPRPRSSKREVRNESTSVAEAPCVSPSTRNLVFRRAHAKCEFVDPVNRTRCESKHLLEIDHIVPRARGGTNDMSNLRALCRAHNLHAAEQVFGEKHMRRFRR